MEIIKSDTEEVSQAGEENILAATRALQNNSELNDIDNTELLLRYSNHFPPKVIQLSVVSRR